MTARNGQTDSPTWIEPLLDRLTGRPVCGYRSEGPAASEPTALAALALVAHDRPAAARPATDWLARVQSKDGSVGICEKEPTPGWPTGLAVVAWRAARPRPGNRARGTDYADPVQRACRWILAPHNAKTLESHPMMGHDTTLVAWPWVDGTHSWIEPTALQLIGLRAAGLGRHPRAKEAVALLLDRQLPGGGCNYGNTFVMGQQLRPHIVPTALALLALQGQEDRDGRVARSVSYLAHSVSDPTTPMSLAWALQALAAYARAPSDAASQLNSASCLATDGQWSPYKAALVALAAAGVKSPLVTLPTADPIA